LIVNWLSIYLALSQCKTQGKIAMRNRVHRNFQLGTLSIADVELNEKSRHQLPKLLKALQYIYINDDLRKPILDICPGTAQLKY